ncbi:transposon ty3-I gag-pol polyprotein [Tanacetum coccineum]
MTKRIPPKCFRCGLSGHRLNACPNRKLNACVGENHEGNTIIDHSEDFEHIVNLLKLKAKLLDKERSWGEGKNEIFKIPIVVGSSYRDVVACDVVDLSASHVVLRRPRQHDVDAVNRGKKNLYVFNWCVKNIAILPNGTRPPGLKTLFVRSLVEGNENSGGEFFSSEGE